MESIIYYEVIYSFDKSCLYLELLYYIDTAVVASWVVVQIFSDFASD